MNREFKCSLCGAIFHIDYTNQQKTLDMIRHFYLNHKDLIMNDMLKDKQFDLAIDFKEICMDGDMR